MKNEFKYFLYVSTILGFFIFIGNYYFSDKNVRKNYRAQKIYSSELNEYSNNLKTLESDTDNFVEYTESNLSKNKKKYKFWELIFNNDK